MVPRLPSVLARIASAQNRHKTHVGSELPLASWVPPGWLRMLIECLLRKKTCLLAQEEAVSSSPTRRQVSLFNTKTCLCIEPENIAFCWARRQCHLGRHEDPSSWWTRRHVFLLLSKRCLFAYLAPRGFKKSTIIYIYIYI